MQKLTSSKNCDDYSDIDARSEHKREQRTVSGGNSGCMNDNGELMAVFVDNYVLCTAVS
jgi:hypothetical protein